MASRLTEGLAALRREAHRLYGSGSTFGYRDITAVAGNLEQLVDRALAGRGLDAGAIGNSLERLEAVARRIERSGGRKPRSQSADRDAVPGSRE